MQERNEAVKEAMLLRLGFTETINCKLYGGEPEGFQLARSLQIQVLRSFCFVGCEYAGSQFLAEEKDGSSKHHPFQGGSGTQSPFPSSLQARRSLQ